MQNISTQKKYENLRFFKVHIFLLELTRQRRHPLPKFSFS
jgi:hypothetical protein